MIHGKANAKATGPSLRRTRRHSLDPAPDGWALAALLIGVPASPDGAEARDACRVTGRRKQPARGHSRQCYSPCQSGLVVLNCATASATFCSTSAMASAGDFCLYVTLSTASDIAWLKT